MKRTILLLTLLVSFSSLTVGQKRKDTIYYNRNWDETTRELAGYYRLQKKIKTEDTTYWEFGDYYMDNDQLQNEGFLTKLRPEVREGYWKWYYQSGKPKMEGLYHDNNSISEWKYYHTNGALKKIGKYTDKGKRDGEWFWYHDDSTLMSKVLFNQDTITGERIWYHENGKKRMHEFYVDGRLDSLKKEWYSTGQLKSEVKYSGGFKNGEEKIYYLNGGVKSVINYKVGISHEEDEQYFSMEGDSVPKDSVVNEKEFHNLLWKITGNGIKKPSYLFGTMHVKNKEAFEFSDSMLLAFNSVEGYSMEIHPDSLYSYYFKAFDKYKSSLFLGSEVIGEYNPSRFYNPWQGYGGYDKWVMNLNEIFHRDTYEPDGMPYFVDCYLYYIAKKHGKYTDGIELVSDHVNAGKDLPRNDFDYDILTKFNPAEEMLLTYQEGNLKKINALMELLQDEEFRYRLLTVRNIKMANAIDSLAHLRSTFNTAGTAHLPGDDGVIELLREKGYTLTPVKAIFSGDSLDYTINNFRNNWEKVQPFNTDFTVETPGYLTAFNASGYIRNIFLDPIREIGVDAFQIDDRFYENGSKKSKISEDDIDYLVGYGNEIKSKKKIVHNGHKGLEVIFEEPLGSSYYGKKRSSDNEEKIFNRMRIFRENYQLYVIKVGSSQLDSLYGKYASRYIQSLDLPNSKESTPKVEWSKFTDTIGAFAINSPLNRVYRFLNFQQQSYYSSNGTEHKVNYWTSEDEGDKFTFRYSNSPIGDIYYGDSLTLAREVNYYKNKLTDKIKDSTYSTFNGYPCIDVTLKPNKKHLVRIRLINRGYRHYLQVAQVKNEKTSINKMNDFFDSFEFLSLERQTLEEYVTEVDSVTFTVPKGVITGVNDASRWFVPDRNLEKSTGYNWGSYNYNWDYSYSDDDEDYVEPIEAFTNRKYFYAIDTLTGISYQAYIDSYSKYFFVENRDSIFNYYSEIFHGDFDTTSLRLEDSLVGDESIYWRHDTYTRPKQNGEFQLRITNKGPHMIMQRVCYPDELKGDTTIENFFSQTDFSQLSDSINLFEDKALGILDSLLASDSTSQVRAEQALSFYPFDSTHVPLIQEYAMKEMDLDTADFVNSGMQLMRLASYFEDSTNVAFFVNFYDKYTKDSLDLKFDVLQILEEYNDSLAVAKITQFVAEDSLEYVYKYHDDYDDVLEYYEDSLQLYSNNFGAFKNWMKDTLWDLEKHVVKTAYETMSIDSLDHTGIENEYEFLKNHYYWVANVYDSLDRDTSIYREVKNNLIEFTSLMGEFREKDDSLKSIYLKLIDEKDDDLRFAASKALFKNGDGVDAKELDNMLSDLGNRYKLMLVLNEIDRLDLIPEEYLEEKNLIEAQTYHALSKNKYSYRGDNEPVKMKFIKTVVDELNGEKQKFYVYTYYREGYRRVKKIGISNPISFKSKEVTFFDKTSYKEENYSKKEEKKLIKGLIEDWKYDYDWSAYEAAEAAVEF